MESEVRERLAAALAEVDEDYASLVGDELTEVADYPAPFLRRHRLLRMEHLSPHKPIVFFVGLTADDRALLLTARPENFVRIAQADGVEIDSPQAAIRYATAYLETTRSQAERFYLVRSADEIEFRPNQSPEEEQARTAFIERHRPVIEAPSAQQTGDRFRVTAFAVREQAVERLTLDVERDGAITTEVTTLAEDLPLVYGL